MSKSNILWLAIKPATRLIIFAWGAFPPHSELELEPWRLRTKERGPMKNQILRSKRSAALTKWLHEACRSPGPFIVALVLASFGFSPNARASCRQGCDINFANTFFGDNALLN